MYKYSHFRRHHQKMKTAANQKPTSRDFTSNDPAIYYTEPVPAVDHLYTELNTVQANQPSETDQSVPDSDHHYFELERIETTPTTKPEMNTMNRQKKKDKACPT